MALLRKLDMIGLLAQVQCLLQRHGNSGVRTQVLFNVQLTRPESVQRAIDKTGICCAKSTKGGGTLVANFIWGKFDRYFRLQPRRSRMPNGRTVFR